MNQRDKCIIGESAQGVVFCAFSRLKGRDVVSTINTLLSSCHTHVFFRLGLAQHARGDDAQSVYLSIHGGYWDHKAEAITKHRHLSQPRYMVIAVWSSAQSNAIASSTGTPWIRCPTLSVTCCSELTKAIVAAAVAMRPSTKMQMAYVLARCICARSVTLCHANGDVYFRL